MADSWTDPAFVAEAHEWMLQAIASVGRRIDSPIEQPHVMPWSTVFRAATDRGRVYLKACGPTQEHEPRLTDLLVRTVPELVPTVLAIHPQRPWMLLADGGEKLRDLFGGSALLDEWAKILPRYAELQIALLDHEDEILGTGTPDHRLELLAEQLEAVLDDRRVLGLASESLTETELERLRSLLPRIEERCLELNALGIGPSVQHDDLHDGNVLSDGRRTVVFDWGDACLTHPFLTLRVEIRVAAYRADLRADDPAILRLVDAYLEPWTRFASIERLRAAAESGRRLGTITRVLTWYAVVTRVDEAVETGEGNVAHALREITKELG